MIRTTGSGVRKGNAVVKIMQHTRSTSQDTPMQSPERSARRGFRRLARAWWGIAGLWRTSVSLRNTASDWINILVFAQAKLMLLYMIFWEQDFSQQKSYWDFISKSCAFIFFLVLWAFVWWACVLVAASHPSLQCPCHSQGITVKIKINAVCIS